VLGLNLVFYFIEKLRNNKVKLNPEKSIVVITGCDSGFGEMTAKLLAKRGYHVVSTCLTDEGMMRLENVVALTVKCDVTKEADIDALAAATEEYATSTGCNVWGVVNNAGIVDGGNLDWTEMKVWRLVLEVNFFAVVAVAKAMLPLLKKTPGNRCNVYHSELILPSSTLKLHLFPLELSTSLHSLVSLVPLEWVHILPLSTP